MTDILEPSRRVKELPSIIFTTRDMRKVNDMLREIQSQCLALEINYNNAMVENAHLVHEANKGKVDVEIPF